MMNSLKCGGGMFPKKKSTGISRRSTLLEPSLVRYESESELDYNVPSNGVTSDSGVTSDIRENLSQMVKYLTLYSYAR